MKKVLLVSNEEDFDNRVRLIEELDLLPNINTLDVALETIEEFKMSNNIPDILIIHHSSYGNEQVLFNYIPELRKDYPTIKMVFVSKEMSKELFDLFIRLGIFDWEQEPISDNKLKSIILTNRDFKTAMQEGKSISPGMVNQIQTTEKDWLGQEDGEGYSVCFWKSRGGSGSSFLTVNVAYQCAKILNKKILISDLNLESPAISFMLNHLEYKGNGLDNIILNKNDDLNYETVFNNIVKDPEYKIGVLQGVINYDYIKRLLETDLNSIMVKKLTSVRENIVKLGDISFFDLEKSLYNEITQTCMKKSHIIYVVINDIFALSEFTRYLKNFLENLKVEDKIRIIYNQTNPDENMKNYVLNVLKQIEFPCVAHIPYFRMKNWYYPVECSEFEKIVSDINMICQ